MTFKTFILDTMFNNPEIFHMMYPYHMNFNAVLTSNHCWEPIQHFMTVFNSYLTDANYFYTPLSNSKVPNLADGLFYTPFNLPDSIKDLWYSVQYKCKGFDNDNLLKTVSKIRGIFKDYNATSSLIQIGLRNDLHLEELNSMVFPNKIWIQDYSFLNQPVTEEFMTKTGEMIEHLKTNKNWLYNKDINTDYHQYHQLIDIKKDCSFAKDLKEWKNDF